VARFESKDWGLSMPSSSEYQFYAEERFRPADEVDNEEHRQAFLEMAKFGRN
jgi:hypothetical protein